jgi:hypothetical protein
MYNELNWAFHHYRRNIIFKWQYFCTYYFSRFRVTSFLSPFITITIFFYRYLLALILPDNEVTFMITIISQESKFFLNTYQNSLSKYRNYFIKLQLRHISHNKPFLKLYLNKILKGFRKPLSQIYCFLLIIVKKYFFYQGKN